MQQTGSIIFILLLFCLGFNCSQLKAQGRPAGVGSDTPDPSTTGQSGNNSGRLFDRNAVSLDTFDAQYFYQTNPFLILDKQDTLLDQNFGQPDPAFWGDFAFANLGNIGSPLSPLVYQSKIRSGLNIGFNSFDNYYLDKDEIKYYHVKKPIVNAIYNQGKTQDDQHFQVEFATQFGKSLSYTIHHRRINHMGVFTNQLARNYALNTGFWFHRPDGKYQAFISFNSNSTMHLENGGVDTAAVNDVLRVRENTVPVLLSQDTTRYIMRKGNLVHYYHLRSPVPKSVKDTSTLAQFPLLPRDSIGGKGRPIPGGKPGAKPPRKINRDSLNTKVIPDNSNQTKPIVLDSLGLDSMGLDSTIILDSIGVDSLLQDSLKIIKKIKKRDLTYYDPNRLFPKRRQVSLGHELTFFAGFYKYADLNPDSSFYGPLFLYNQGVQTRAGHRGIENSFFIATTSINKPNTAKTQSPRDFFRAGVKHSFNNIRQFGDTLNTNNISLFGNLNYSPFEKLTVAASTEFFLTGYNAGDFFLEGSINFNVKNIGQLWAYGHTQAKAPAYIQNNLRISSIPIFHNDFRKTVETKLGGTLAIAKTNTAVSFNFHLLDNFIYYDTLAMAAQAQSIFAIPQFVIKQPIRVGNIHLDNTIVFQTSDDNVFALPKIFSKHSLYFEGTLFKQSLLLKLGVDGVFYTDYRARKYQPLIGQFYNSNEDLKYFPQLDPFVSFKKGRWRLYFRMQNAASALLTEDFEFRTPNYPIPYRVFRFGLAMILIN